MMLVIGLSCVVCKDANIFWHYQLPVLADYVILQANCLVWNDTNCKKQQWHLSGLGPEQVILQV